MKPVSEAFKANSISDLLLIADNVHSIGLSQTSAAMRQVAIGMAVEPSVDPSLPQNPFPTALADQE